MAREKHKQQGPAARTEISGAPLSRYRSKRDFSITAEPRGAKDPQHRRTDELPFVVQKHAATRLHYDFRLGWKGVLKSWAVAKGPSYYPGDKRLAVQVEDHPMDYKDFEGTIPKGQYGGGTVMVWDRGSWEPHGDVDRGLEEGHLKFELHGSKLKGAWALVRMNGRAGGSQKSNWLLIKEHDEFERPKEGPAIIDEAGLSAVTKRSLQQIAEAKDHVERNSASANERSAGRRRKGSGVSGAGTKPKASRKAPENLSASLRNARREAFPGFIAPQLAQQAREVPEGTDWVHELKLDGYRIQIHIQSVKRTSGAAQGRQVRLLTRKNLDWARRMPSIAAAAARLDVEDAILDGEAVALDKNGVADFANLQAAFEEGKEAELTYFAFDLLHLDGLNLRGLPLFERKTILAELLQMLGKASVLRFSEHLQDRGREMFTEACRLGAEGIVSKLATSKYTSGRSRAWLKLKCFQEQELVIGGFTPRSNDSHGIGSLLLGYYDQGKLHYAGRSGTGFSQQMQQILRDRLDPLLRKSPAFADRPGGVLRDVRWVEPVLVAQIVFSNWTRDNLVRQASFKGLREDKPAKEVVREMAEGSSNVSPPRAARGKAKTKARKSRSKGGAVGMDMAHIAITHPEKVLDETTGMTKQDLAAYYTAVSAEMLRYIADRPLSIVRCPDGNSESCFFQKHVGMGVPESVKTIPVPSRKGGATENYLTVDSQEGLVGLAQMSVLEIHSWGSRNESLNKPDQIVIDLDPDVSIDWKTLAGSAQELREHLEGIGLESFLKGTGGKGLHVVVPIRAEHEWPVVKGFSHALVRQLEDEKPDLYVTKMSKAVRKGHIFLDYLRNDREATAIAPFSPRARAGAPVALPLDWKELRGDAMPVFRVADFALWKERLEDDRWAGIYKVRQRLTSGILRDSRI